MTGNPLETRRECSDYKKFLEFGNDVFPILSLLDGETPPPNGPISMTCILSLRSGLDESEMVNAHLTETEPEFFIFRLLHALRHADEIGSNRVHFNHYIACIGLTPAPRLANQTAPFTGKIAILDAG